MRVFVNDKPVELAPGLTLRRLIEQFGLGQAAVAAEVNKTLVPKRDHESRVLADGDRIELVTLVGGG